MIFINISLFYEMTTITLIRVLCGLLSVCEPESLGLSNSCRNTSSLTIWPHLSCICTLDSSTLSRFPKFEVAIVGDRWRKNYTSYCLHVWLIKRVEFCSFYIDNMILYVPSSYFFLFFYWVKVDIQNKIYNEE